MLQKNRAAFFALKALPLDTRGRCRSDSADIDNVDYIGADREKI
jgi:hypothetical protein